MMLRPSRADRCGLMKPEPLSLEHDQRSYTTARDTTPQRGTTSKPRC